MAKNKTLIAQINARAVVQGVEVKTEGLTNKELTVELNKLKSSALAKPASVVVAPAVVKVEPVPVVKKTGHVVASGRCITTKRGILAGGQVISVNDIGGGAEAFDKLVDAEYIQKVK